MVQHNLAENKFKRYVSVVVCYKEGLPRSNAEILRIRFRDGSVWVVDKTHPGYWAAAQKAGGRGMLYPILATRKQDDDAALPGEQHEFHLFNDEDEWFVELEEAEREVW